MQRGELQLVAELVVVAEAEMLTVCRMILMGVGAGLPLSDEALDDLKLVLSEACASAIRQTIEPDGTVEIAFRTSDSEIEVSVSDRAQDVSTALSGRGFGLPLLRKLCSRLDIDSRPDGPGTVVRFAQTLPA
ncbi:MAG: Histidine kinaselike ATPase domain [Gaiellales bacterium]|nr:Histidine kinaselike ATPase domain [Gaiellales bacterium]